MKILMGYTGYKFMKDNNLPMRFFYGWILEKWKHDLMVIIILPPLIISITILKTGEKIESVGDLFCCFLFKNLERSSDGMTDRIRDLRKWEEDNNICIERKKRK